jgi:hypothetical protein
MEIGLPRDFKDFLKFLNEEEVDYLLIGGYAVGYYGYPRGGFSYPLSVLKISKLTKKLVEDIKI